MSNKTKIQYKFPFKHLVFEGGGARIVGFTRIPVILENYGILKQITKVAGTSAGAIMATLIAIGVNPLDIERLIRTIKFTDFIDSNWGFIRNSYRFLKNFGLYKGDIFYDWLGDIIADHIGYKDATFIDLYDFNKMELVITGTCLNTFSTEYFSYKTTPDMPIRLAVRISISIPLFFEAVKYNNKIYTDGGVIANFPIWIFDSDDYNSRYSPVFKDSFENYQTIGFKLVSKCYFDDQLHGFNASLDDSDESINQTNSDKNLNQTNFDLGNNIDNISNIATYIKTLIQVLLFQIENLSIRTGYWNRTVVINTLNLKSTQFDIPHDLMDKIIDNGEMAITNYIESFMMVYPQINSVVFKNNNMQQLLKKPAKTSTSPDLIG